MPGASSDWRLLLEASTRKLAVAAYHVDCLEKEQSSTDGSSKRAPSIPVQAHFEGTIVSVMAAVDQVAQAIKSVLRLGLRPSDLVEGAFSQLAQAAPEIGSWFREPIGCDLRRIRVRMVHYSYAKTPRGPCWVVESAGTDFKGQRELLAYARNALEYGSSLQSLLPVIEAEIASRVGAGSESHRDGDA